MIKRLALAYLICCTGQHHAYTSLEKLKNKQENLNNALSCCYRLLMQDKSIAFRSEVKKIIDEHALELAQVRSKIYKATESKRKLQQRKLNKLRCLQHQRKLVKDKVDKIDEELCWTYAFMIKMPSIATKLYLHNLMMEEQELFNQLTEQIQQLDN